MRIAILSRHFSRAGGGAESYAVNLVQGLAPRHEIHVFSQTSNHPVDGVIYHSVFRLSEKPRWLNQLVFAFLTWLQTRRGYDIVHSHENTWQGQIQTIHVRPVRHSLFSDSYGLHRIFRWLKIVTSPRLLTYLFLEGSRYQGSLARKVVATSEHLLKECEQAYPNCVGKTEVIPPGVHLPKSLPTQATAREKLGLVQKGWLILFVANDYARKGLSTVLKALALLPCDVRLAVIGNPHAVPKYQLQTRQLGVEGRVQFMGSLNDLSPAYAAADCLVHPTLEDSFAMVVLEAMAHGLPVIVSGPDQCGISRLLTHGVNAMLLSNPRNEEALATAIRAVLNSKNLAHELCENGRIFARERTWDKAVLQYENLYSQAVGSMRDGK